MKPKHSNSRHGSHEDGLAEHDGVPITALSAGSALAPVGPTERFDSAVSPRLDPGESSDGSTGVTQPIVIPVKAGASGRLEADARGAMEGRAGRSFTDVEWAVMRGRLLEFTGILLRWHRNRGCLGGTVERICQRED